MTEIPNLVGHERSLIYQIGDVGRMIEDHIRLSLSKNVISPYFEKTDKGRNFFLEYDLDDTCRVRVGSIGAFDTSTMSIWLNEQVTEYVFQGTMGQSFPYSNSQIIENLFAEMIGGFRDSHLIVSMEVKTKNSWQPYAGVTAYLGEGDDQLWNSVQSQKSSLSTFWALDHTNDLPTDEIFMESEKNILEMSRLWKRNGEILSELGVRQHDIGWQCMAFLALGIEEAVLSGFYDDSVSWVVYDTSRRIQESLKKNFGMREILDESMLKPGKPVLGSVLAYHYGGPEWGGYAGKVVVGKASLGEYAHESKKFLKRKNIYSFFKK